MVEGATSWTFIATRKEIPAVVCVVCRGEKVLCRCKTLALKLRGIGVVLEHK